MKKLKIANKIFDIIFFIFLGLCLIVAVVPFVLRVHLYTIASNSMEPKMSVGDLVVTKKVELEDLKKQDIIAYRRDDIVVTHRIIGINEKNNTLITKGDNNAYADSGEIIESQVLGKVILNIPFIGHIYSFIRIYSLWICIFILVFGCVLNYLNNKANKKNEVRKWKKKKSGK
ncbi:MAG: signal peptidase I [Bacilli bacterium]|nr:signal peptidase I [Bacilli bacterium]